MKRLLIGIFLLVTLTSLAEASKAKAMYHQVSLLLNVTQRLNSIYRFDNLILYRTPKYLAYTPILESYNDHQFNDTLIEYDEIIVKSFLIPSMVFTISPWDYKDNATAIPNLGNILTNQNLAIVILNDIFNKELKEFVAISLGASLETKIVWLLIGDELTGVPTSIRTEKMRQFFRWAWSKNILNTILIFQKDIYEDFSDFAMETFSYSPFPWPVQLQNLTKADPAVYFPEKMYDIKQYEFQSPVFFDRPNVFLVNDSRSGEEFVTGNVGRLYMEFVSNINGKFNRIRHQAEMAFEERTQYMLKLLQSQLIEVGIHPMSCLLPFNGSVSYPVTHTSSCVIVPYVPEINLALYLPYTFNGNIWFILMLNFVVMTVFQAVESCLYAGAFAWVRSMLVTLQGMLNLPRSFRRRRQREGGPRYVAYQIAALLLTITGLIFTHLHVASLTSLLSTSVDGRQLETVDDLRAANVSIMLPVDKANLYRRLDIFPDNFTDHLLIAQPQRIAQLQNSLNNSYAYVMYAEEWRVVNELQTKLGHPKFKVARRMCIPNVYFALPLQFNSPFYHPLKDFILWTHASGLESKWSDIVFSEIQQESRNQSIIGEPDHPAAITLRHLAIAWAIWLGGVLVAFAAFVGEHVKRHLGNVQ